MSVTRWYTWLERRAPRRRWASLSTSLGKHHSYLGNMQLAGCIPPPPTVRDLARLLEASEAEALAHAGYAPADLTPEEWEDVLTDLQSQRLRPELRAALRGLEGLSAAQLREADAMLVGLARGFALAREQRRRAS